MATLRYRFAYSNIKRHLFFYGKPVFPCTTIYIYIESFHTRQQQQKFKTHTDRKRNMSNSGINTPEGKIARDVALQFIQKRSGKFVKTALLRKETQLMLRLAEEIELKHELFLSNVCKRLQLTPSNAQANFFAIADEIFADQTNWGRIIVLYAFAGKLAQHYRGCEGGELVLEKLPQWVGGFVAKKSSWIRETGRGWNGFIETFDTHHDSWVQGLFGLTLGLGTIAAAIYIRS